MKMKKLLCTVLTLSFLVSGTAFAGFSASSTQFDPNLAQEALQIAEMCYMPSMQASLLALSNYRRVGLFNAERSETDTRHVATYGIYDRLTENGQTEVIIAIRGTGNGEWKLNFELMPSGNFDLPYSENFSLAADDILSTQQDYLASLVSPVFLITGHSRGAAVANILGARLTDRFKPENVFVYTFATPRTVRGEYPAYSNIFNVVNPADVITYLPLPQWGFERYGIDVELPVERASLLDAAKAAYAARTDCTTDFPMPKGRSEATKQFIDTLASLAPQIQNGFVTRHALNHPGLAEGDEPGMTAGEFLLNIFDGNLLSNSGSSNALSQMTQEFTQADNDLVPILHALNLLSEGGNSDWVSAMHMPACYGAWLSAME